MKISTKGRYALRLMIELALCASEDYITLDEVAKKQGLSVKYLEQIAGALRRSGLLLSVRGPQGGYKLAKKPSEYTAGEILHVTEGSLAPVACLNTVPPSCVRKDICPTMDFWQGLHQCILNYVNNVTLQSLAECSKNKEQMNKKPIIATLIDGCHAS